MRAAVVSRSAAAARACSSAIAAWAFAARSRGMNTASIIAVITSDRRPVETMPRCENIQLRWSSRCRIEYAIQKPMNTPAMGNSA